MGTVIPPIMEAGINIVRFFEKKAVRSDAIQFLPRDAVREALSRPLGELYGSLIRADTEIELYLSLLANTNGSFKEMLMQKSSQFFIPRVEAHLNLFMKILTGIEENWPEVNESIKGNACKSRDYYGEELLKQLEFYKMRYENGMPLAVSDIIAILDAYKRLTDCYATGILAAIEDLPHAGRMAKS